MITEFDVQGLLQAFGSGEARPSEAVEASLAKIGESDDVLRAVLALPAERAREEAAEADRRWKEGRARPLEGVPFGVKDVIDTADVVTTGGSPIHRHRVPTTDAIAIARLRSAGAILTAKLQTFEFAFGSNPHFGPGHNPWDLLRTAGGSSEGPGVALAARLLPLAIGSDSGGSIRIPASLCGVTGFKPTAGTVPTAGLMPLSPSLDHVGPMARTARDCALAMSAMAPGFGDVSPAIESVRVGVAENWFWDVLDPDVEAAGRACADFLSDAGALVFGVQVPHAELAEEVCWTLMAAEAAQVHRHTDRGRLGAPLRDLVADGERISAGDYHRALEERQRIRQAAETALFAECDVLLTPGTPCTAPRLDDMMATLGDRQVPWLEVVARTTMWHNLVGCAAVAIPFGLDRHRLPLSVQLASRTDAQCLSLAIAIQAATDHHLLRPDPLS